VRRGLARSREVAHAAIVDGRVTVAGAPATKPSRLVDSAEPVELHGPGPRFVSRGGAKLAAALERFSIVVDGRPALDAGASTGGFTDCLLQSGASHVVAVDVGRGQLHERLRSDARVEVRERTHVADLDPGSFAERPMVIVADLSFISLRRALPALVAVAARPADLVLLVKPQFEAGRAEASKGKGVITDPNVWRRVLGEIVAALESLGAVIMDAMPSPVRGADGNVEFFLHARLDDARATVPPAAIDLDAVVVSVAAEAR
jgi:23S rRNA (cytidine1920-2'-O)/16S rRNA (cytidine1409-2'-O)-methyltransferase